MELISIRQVSLDYGISRQVLYYYEEIGLLKSSRRNDYAYRLYDEDAIKRLQQIIILRKLQIPMKQIKDIINNPTAAAVIEMFKQNIDELDEQITALSTVKSILTRLVAELEEKADISLKLDLLNDKTMLAVVSTLPFSENKINNVKEKVTMEELNKASEQLDKQKEKNVQIVYRPPATMAVIDCNDTDIPPGDGRHRKIVDAKAKKFIEDTDLFKIKPDMRVFVFGEAEDQGTAWITIPDDFEVPAPYKKIKYPGGLYAACTEDFYIGQWVENSDKYEWDNSNFERAIGWEYFNPYNIYGLDADSTYTMELFPIRELKKLTDEEKETINKTLDKVKSCDKSVGIDFATMTPFNRGSQPFEVNYPNDMIEFKVEQHNGYMLSAQTFNLPLAIKMRAKTDKTGIQVGCAQITIQLSSEFNEFWKDTLNIIDDSCGEFTPHKKCGNFPINEFADIECLLSREGIAVRVNGELWHYGTDYKYVKEFAKNIEYIRAGNVFFGTADGSTVTVESLRVTEI